MPINKIYPVQEAREENDTTEYTFSINDSIYNISEYVTDRYIIGENACVGGMHGVPLSVIPFKYYPNRNEIDVLKSCIVTVAFSQSSVINGNLSIRNKKLVKSIVDNYNPDLLNTYNIPAADSINGNIYNYLIITTDQYKNTDALKEFCAWKRIKGHNCKIVSCSEIGGNKPDSIKACIKQWYEKGVEYVLFVGNHKDIPLYYWDENFGRIHRPAYTDYWYGCVNPFSNSDYYADIAIGRLCIKNSTDLQNMIQKTIQYENLTMNDTWITKNLLVAHKQLAPNKYQGCSEEIRKATYVDSPHFVTAYGANVSNGGNNATNEMVVSYINEGCGLVNYRGHGDSTCWVKSWNNLNIKFDSIEIKKICNRKRTPVLFCVACQTANIVYENCLLYKFMYGNVGAVAYIGATRNTTTLHNHSYNKNLYNILYNKQDKNIGYLNINAHAKTIYNCGSYDKKYSICNAFAYLCGGDPSLEIWTDTISKFPNIDIAYEDGNLSLNTRSIEKYTVTLFSQTDSNYFKKVTVADCDTIITNVPKSFVMSFNKHNYMPLVYKVTDGDIYMQNENFALVRHIIGNNVYVGSNITNLKPQGNVTVKSGAELNIEAKVKTVINNSFIIEQGAKTIIK